MIKYYRTMDHQIHEISEPMEGTWISLIHPTAAELAKIATDYKIDIDDLRAPLDEEERSHTVSYTHLTLPTNSLV